MRDNQVMTREVEPQTRRDARHLPTITLGFIPLTDCAVLAVARERGFAVREGIDLRLSREVSWANIRDKVALGHLHGAQMLAGMPIATTLGINQIPMPMQVPFCLNRNGNAITVSNTLHDAMAQGDGFPAWDDVAAAGRALHRVIAQRQAEGRAPLTFGMVYPFSCHNYELRYWMAASGIDPDNDVRLVVVPPPLMVDSLRDGHIDGFCVGEPWSSVAVEANLGRIIVSKAKLWRHGMEKVVGVPKVWASQNGAVLAALIRALDRAAAWADDPVNCHELATLLAAPEYLGMPEGVVARALCGEILTGSGLEHRAVADFLVLHRNGANLPSVEHALWIYSQMVRWRQAVRRPGDEALIRSIFRPDVYRAALAGAAWEPDTMADSPEIEASDELDLFDHRPFDPTNIDAYLA